MIISRNNGLGRCLTLGEEMAQPAPRLPVIGAAKGSPCRRARFAVLTDPTYGFNVSWNAAGLASRLIVPAKVSCFESGHVQQFSATDQAGRLEKSGRGR